MNNQEFVTGLVLNEIDKVTIDKMVQLKNVAEALGWTMDSYDGMDGNVYITFMVVREDQVPEYDSAGYSESDRIKSNIVIDDITHHCDDPSCNCSI